MRQECGIHRISKRNEISFEMVLSCISLTSVSCKSANPTHGSPHVVVARFRAVKKRGGTVSDHRVFPSRREINRDLVKFGAALSVVAIFGCWLTNKGSLENYCYLRP